MTFILQIFIGRDKFDNVFMNYPVALLEQGVCRK